MMQKAAFFGCVVIEAEDEEMAKLLAAEHFERDYSDAVLHPIEALKVNEEPTARMTAEEKTKRGTYGH